MEKLMQNMWLLLTESLKQEELHKFIHLCP